MSHMTQLRHIACHSIIMRLPKISSLEWQCRLSRWRRYLTLQFPPVQAPCQFAGRQPGLQPGTMAITVNILRGSSWCNLFRKPLPDSCSRCWWSLIIRGGGIMMWWCRRRLGLWVVTSHGRLSPPSESCLYSLRSAARCRGVGMMCRSGSSIVKTAAVSSTLLVVCNGAEHNNVDQEWRCMTLVRRKWRLGNINFVNRVWSSEKQNPVKLSC